MDISEIGRQFGLDEAQTRAAFDALAPVVAAGVRRNAQTTEGLQEIFKSVLSGGNGSTWQGGQINLDRTTSAGNDVVGQIFGSKDVSREVAQQLSATSGVGAAILKQLLPIIAAMVMGQLAKKIGSGSPSGGTDKGLGDILGDVLGGNQKTQGSGGGLGDVLKDVLGGGQPTSPPSQPPAQGSGRSLGDILGDILGGGANDGRVVAKQIPSDQMGEILKDIFGGTLPGTAGGSTDSPARQPSQDSVAQGRRTLDDILGGGTKGGSAADDLLNSVDDAIRRRR